MNIIPKELVRKFLEVAGKNLSSEDERHVETLAFLIGYREEGNRIATNLIFPNQKCLPGAVIDRGINGEDSMEWVYHSSNLAKKKEKPELMAWIHSHVRGSECGFSSIDVHTQYTYNLVYNGILGIVVEIDESGDYKTHDIFELTEKGNALVAKCSKKKNCKTDVQHDSCSHKEFFESCKDEKVLYHDDTSLKIDNFMVKDEISQDSTTDIVCVFNKVFSTKSILKHLNSPFS